ncbi:MAG: hypothetical protein IH965_03900 [Gemmatimonadetes bacterium]|nr:hypothetical protein [Gemmatimonadota bacterium]
MTVRDEDIERIAAGLGRETAEQVDVDRIAVGVVERLRARDGIERPRRTFRWLAIAAALALAAGVTFMSVRTRSVSEGAEQIAAAPLLDQLLAEELAEVLDSLSLRAPVSEQLRNGLDDLDERQLEELLATMEG